MPNKIRLHVGGIELYINSDLDEAYVQRLGNELNHRVQELMSKNGFLSTTMAAVLMALEYCDDAKKAHIDSENLRSQIKQYIEDAAGARLEADEARREIERLNKENQTLRGRLSRK